MLKQLVHPSRFSVPLTEDATINTFKVSTEHASYIDTFRLAYSGTLRMLIIQPPTVDKNYTYYDHITVSGINLTTGMCYAVEIPQYLEFSVASGTEVSTNLIPDGNMEYYDTSCWRTSGTGGDILSISKSGVSYDGGNSLIISMVSGTASNYQRVFNIVSGTDYEDVLFSGITKTVSGYSGLAADLYTSYYTSPSSDIGYFSVSGTTDWVVNRGCTRFFPDFTAYFETGIRMRLNGCSVYLDNLSVVKNLVRGGGFLDITKDRYYWQNVNSLLYSAVPSGFSTEKGNSGVGYFTATANGGYIAQNIRVVANTYYTFTGYFYKYALIFSYGNFKVKLVGLETSTVYYDSGWNITPINYTKLATTIKNTTDTTIQIQVILETQNTYLALDSISFIPVVETVSNFGTPSISNYYDYSKWYANPDSSLLISGSSLFCVGITSGTNLNPDAGSIGLWYNPVRDYDDFTGDSVVISGGGINSNFMRVYYNSSDYKFYGQVYNGTEWITSGCVSDAQTFVSGTWMHLAFSYDSTNGTKLFIDGNQVGEFYGSWPNQELSTLVSIGSISGSYGGRAEGFYDDIVFYPKALNVDNWYKKTLENTDYM